MAASSVELDNWQSQIDEIQALEAIFEDDFQITSIDGINSCDDNTEPSWDAASLAALDCPRDADDDLLENHSWSINCQLVLHIDPPACGFWEISLEPFPRPLTSSTTISKAVNQEPPPPPQHVIVTHLPPIILSVKLHSHYPSSHPPEVQLSSLLLSRRQSAAVVAELTRQWEEQGCGLAICYTWCDWINSTDFITYLRNTNTTTTSIINSNTAAEADEGGKALGGDGCFGLERESEEKEEGRLIALVRYDHSRQITLFQQRMHRCSICFEEQRGDLFMRLDCNHTFCRSCLAHQAKLHVTEGTIEKVKCPEPGCGEALGAHLLKRLLSEELYERWDTLILAKALDAMSDAAYCPRCGTLSLEDTEENCADCPKCFYVFCTLCCEGRHPGVQCVSAETRLEMLRKKAEGGGAAAVAELRRKENDVMSLAEIEKSTKPCPSCGMAIQRSEGCNKMVCGNCSAAFCYKCGKQIAGYDHYKAGGGCVLFDEAEILRWERRWEEQVGGHAAAAFRNDYLLEFGEGGEGGGAHNFINRRNVVGGDGGGGNAPPQIANCPCCGQPNYKFARNNHMQCWSCTRYFCAVCRLVLQRRGSGRTHFGPSGCPQHS